MQKIAQETGLGTLVTLTGGSATTLIDTSSVLTGPYSAQRFAKGSPVRYTTLNGAASSECTAVSDYNPATGTITLSPATTASKAADKAIIWSGIDHPDRVTEAIDRGLTRHCFHWVPVPLTDVPDGDMGDSGVTLWGTAVDCTTTKVSMAWPMSFGQRYMFTNLSGANGYQPSAAIPCQEGDGWKLDVLVYVVSGTAVLSAYDQTNSAAITLNGDGGSYAGTGWKRLRNTFSVPSGCETLTIRLGGTGATDDVYWTSVVAHPLNRRRFTLPSRVTRDPGEVLIRRGEEYEDMRLLSYGSGASIAQSPVGLAVELPTAAGDPVYVEVAEPYDALATDAATTDCAEELAVIAGIYELYKLLARQKRTIQTVSGYVTNSDMKVLMNDALVDLKSKQASFGAESKRVYR